MLTLSRVCRGELPEDMSSAYEKQRKSYEALQRTVASLADTLEKAMPDLPEPSSVTRTGDGCITVLTGRVSWQSQAYILHDSLQHKLQLMHMTQGLAAFKHEIPVRDVMTPVAT